MKTFHETFKDRIDMTDGTVVLTEKAYKEIQKDALEHALIVVTEDVDNVTGRHIVFLLNREINSL